MPFEKTFSVSSSWNRNRQFWEDAVHWIDSEYDIVHVIIVNIIIWNVLGKCICWQHFSFKMADKMVQEKKNGVQIVDDYTSGVGSKQFSPKSFPKALSKDISGQPFSGFQSLDDFHLSVFPSFIRFQVFS